MKQLLAIFIDAFRYDYLSKEKTPFLNSIKNNGFHTPLKTLLGYSDAIDASIFTGVYPEDHGHWIMHKFSPESSPYKMFKVLSLIEYCPSNFIVRGIKFLLSASICKMIGKTLGYSNLSTHNIPFKVIDLFDWTSKRSLLKPYPFTGIPTIFDILKENGIKYSYVDTSKLSFNTRYSSSVKIRGKLLKSLRKLHPDNQFTCIYLHQLDHFAHRFRINSPEFCSELQHIDKTIELTINNYKLKFGNELIIMIFSDHGMVDTTKFIDLRTIIRENGFGKDFLLFLDSTMIHVWYLNEEKKGEIRRRIEDLDCGIFISQSEKERLKINFNNRYYGDDIYLLTPGYSIFPNFMSWLKPYSMHAYHPDDQTQFGTMMLHGPNLEFQAADWVETVDIAPSILDIFGIDIPTHFKGNSILRH